MCGLGFEDFCLCTPIEFQAIMDAFGEMEDARRRDMWERMRILAAISVSPFSKSRVRPENIIRLPWDNERKQAAIVSKEDDIKALQRRLRQIKGN